MNKYTFENSIVPKYKKLLDNTDNTSRYDNSKYVYNYSYYNCVYTFEGDNNTYLSFSYKICVKRDDREYR